MNGKTLWSKEWWSLLSSRQVIYLHLKSKYNGLNNGKIFFSYSEFEGQMSKTIFYESLDDLENRGWIRRKRKGGKRRFYYLNRLTGKYDEIDKPRKPFVGLGKELLSRQAWKDLSWIARSHYLLIKCSPKGRGEGKLTLPYSKIKGAFAYATSSKARKELIDKGWIEVDEEGGGLFGNPTCYKLTRRYDWWPKKGPYTW